jgi:hypothetical protein
VPGSQSLRDAVRWGAVVVVVAAAVAAAGCGGGGEEGTETFDEAEFAILFDHPSSFEELEDVSIASTAGAASKATSARGLDDRNLILVSRYDLNVEVGDENLADVRRELDAVVSQAAKQELTGTQVEFGGLPGYEYDFDLDTEPPVQSRFVVLFDGDTEYTLNCQSTSEARSDVEAACQQAVDTLRTR